MHTLTIERLTKRYKKKTVVQDLSLEVHPGRVTGFLGPNGAGKSTTMKVLLGLASANEGRATIGGARYRDLSDPGRTVGAVLESNAFHPGRSARSHLLVLADGIGVPVARVDELMELVGLSDARDRNVGAYSLGMRQRLGLAGALLADPPVLVLDEPGNGLDPQGIRWLRDLLRARAKDGGTVFVSSHLMSEVEHLADEIVVIDRGRLVTAGAISDLARQGTLVRTPSPEQLGKIVEAAGGTVQVRPDGALTVRGLAIGEIGDHAHAAHIALHELSPQAGSLEDLFLEWTGGAAPVEAASPREEVPE
jgi:ABC-2 type transport system ATP-binding protein